MYNLQCVHSAISILHPPPSLSRAPRPVVRPVEALLDLGVALPVYLMQIVGPAVVTPGHTPGVIRFFGDVEDGTYVIDLAPPLDWRREKGGVRTLRLVRRALIELTKGESEMTVAPSLRSRNFGRSASFTAGVSGGYFLVEVTHGSAQRPCCRRGRRPPWRGARPCARS